MKILARKDPAGEKPAPGILQRRSSGDQPAAQPQFAARPDGKQLVVPRPAAGDGKKQIAPRPLSVETAPQIVQRPAETVHASPSVRDNIARRLVGSDWSFSAEAFSEVLNENPGFTVVGTLGCQGCGKTTILNALAYDGNAGEAPFVVAPDKGISMEHCTDGMEAVITTQQVILLDVQPILSTSVHAQHPSTAAHRDLQAAVFLLAVCDVVLVVQDWILDLELLNFLRTALMLAALHRAPAPGQGSRLLDTVQPVASVAFVFNKICEEDMEQEHAGMATTFLSDMFRSSHSPNQELHTFLLPLSRAGDEHGAPLHASFSSVIRQLREYVAGLPTRFHGATECTWLAHASETWEHLTHPDSPVANFAQQMVL